LLVLRPGFLLGVGGARAWPWARAEIAALATVELDSVQQPVDAVLASRRSGN